MLTRASKQKPNRHSMKTKILFFLIILIPSLLTYGQGNDWELIFHDEFEIDGQPNWDVWQSENGFVRNNEYQWYQPHNAYTKGGCLILEGRLDSIPNPNYRQDSHDWRKNRPYAKYSSASINTRKSFSFKYGRMEVRARIPAVIGSWPAIWTLGTEMEWPSCGEIDIMEYYHIQGKPHILANAAWGNDYHHNAVWNSKKIPYAHFLEKDPYWNEKFHTWVMDWDEAKLSIYLDGELLNEVNLSTTVNGSVGKHENPMQKPHYILLNLAIGGMNGGEPQIDAFPMRYEIDYVRVYQRK